MQKTSRKILQPVIFMSNITESCRITANLSSSKPRHRRDNNSSASRLPRNRAACRAKSRAISRLLCCRNYAKSPFSAKKRAVKYYSPLYLWQILPKVVELRQIFLHQNRVIVAIVIPPQADFREPEPLVERNRGNSPPVMLVKLCKISIFGKKRAVKNYSPLYLYRILP